MKITTTIVMSVFIVLGLACLAIAEDAKPYDIEISVGGSMNDLDETDGGRVAEYDSTVDKNANWILGGKVSYTLDKVAFDAYGEYLDGDDQAYGANLDLSRILMLETDYLRFFHRLDHDNLNHLLASLARSKQGATLYHTDFNASDNYGITRSEWKSQAKLNVPMVPGLSFTFNHRFEERKGMDQARTMSKCSSCHVVGVSKDISETTNEWNQSVNYRMGPISMNYDFSYRSFNSGSDVPENLYFQAQNPGAAPGTNADFGARLQYDQDDGSLPFSRTADSEKWSHKIKVKADLPADNKVNLSYVYSKATNNDSDDGGSALYGDAGKELSVDYWALNGGWHWKVNKAMAFTLKGKYQDMDGSEVGVDVNDITDVISGTSQTYADFLGEDFDFRRQSAYDEDEYSLDAKFAWKILKDLKLKLGYELEYLDRENAEYHHVVDDTTTQKFSIGSKWRPMMGLRVSADYEFTFVDDPYVFHNTMCPSWDEAQALGFAPGTYSVDSWYSKYVYGVRTMNRSNQPETVNDIRIKTCWMATDKINTNVHMHYKIAENSDAGGSDWEQDMFNGGLNVMYTPTAKLGINFGYNYFYDKYEAMFCSAFYNG
ncbi:MAG: MtrB/PioB family outer membrane beta-barrel protein [Deltaproteobacteria bacterium]|nr:MtrB/PioB family outer membrane beta-barrel protein [Deltaproteobacteria bacterium]